MWGFTKFCECPMSRNRCDGRDGCGARCWRDNGPILARYYRGTGLHGSLNLPKTYTCPSHDASHEASRQWIDEYGTANCRNSVFIKGTLLHNNFSSTNPTIYPV